MPQGKYSVIQKPPDAPKINLPSGNGEDDMLQKALRALLVATGAEEQAPGDLPGFLGATASLLPLGALVSKVRGLKGIASTEKAANMGDALLREHMVPTSPGHEFSPDVSIYQGIPVEEMEKASKMGATVPKRRKPSEPRP